MSGGRAVRASLLRRDGSSGNFSCRGLSAAGTALYACFNADSTKLCLSMCPVLSDDSWRDFYTRQIEIPVTMLKSSLMQSLAHQFKGTWHEAKTGGTEERYEMVLNSYCTQSKVERVTKDMKAQQVCDYNKLRILRPLRKFLRGNKIHRFLVVEPEKVAGWSEWEIDTYMAYENTKAQNHENRNEAIIARKAIQLADTWLDLVRMYLPELEARMYYGVLASWISEDFTSDDNLVHRLQQTIADLNVRDIKSITGTIGFKEETVGYIVNALTAWQEEYGTRGSDERFLLTPS